MKTYELDKTNPGFIPLLYSVVMYENMVNVAGDLKEAVPGELAMMAMIAKEKSSDDARDKYDVGIQFVEAVSNVAHLVVHLDTGVGSFKRQQVRILKQYFDIDEPDEGGLLIAFKKNEDEFDITAMIGDEEEIRQMIELDQVRHDVVN